MRESGIDALAPALGTAPGLYTSELKIDFERLDKIRALVPVPLVLHGGSGIPDNIIRKAIARGISKANIGTEFKVAWAGAIVLPYPLSCIILVLTSIPDKGFLLHYCSFN